MNCQDYLHRREDPQQRTRRWFFEQCGIGVGGIALANLLADSALAASQVVNWVSASFRLP